MLAMNQFDILWHHNQIMTISHISHVMTHEWPTRGHRSVDSSRNSGDGGKSRRRRIRRRVATSVALNSVACVAGPCGWRASDGATAMRAAAHLGDMSWGVDHVHGLVLTGSSRTVQKTLKSNPR